MADGAFRRVSEAGIVGGSPNGHPGFYLKAKTGLAPNPGETFGFVISREGTPQSSGPLPDGEKNSALGQIGLELLEAAVPTPVVQVSGVGIRELAMGEDHFRTFAVLDKFQTHERFLARRTQEGNEPVGGELACKAEFHVVRRESWGPITRIGRAGVAQCKGG